MSMCARKWMSGTPRAALRFITKGIGSAATNVFMDAAGQYSTIPEHMPVNHQLYSEWDKARFLKWASGIGESTHQVIQGIFDSYRIEEQAYKGCLSL